MATVDELQIKSTADMRDLRRELRTLQARLGDTGKQGGRAFDGLNNKVSAFRAKIAAAGTAVAALAGGLGVGAIVKAGSTFEDLSISLNTVFGSAEKGQQALARITEFSQTTPFQLEDVTRAFISLRGAGIEPSQDMLQIFADTASTSIDQLGAFEAMVRLVQRSAAGGLGLEEINQLDDRGIPATKILTEQLGLSRDQLSQFGASAKGANVAVRVLISGLKERFGGAMEEKMEALSTKTSNATISFKQLADEIFKSGLGDLFKDLTDDVTTFLNELTQALREFNNARLQSLKAQRDDEKARRANLASGGLQARKGSGRGTERGTVPVSDRRIAELDKAIKQLEENLAEPIVQGTGEKPSLGGDSIGGFTDLKGAIAEVKSEMSNVKEEAEEVAVTFKGELASAVQSLSLSFTNDFVNSLLDGKNALQSFANFAKSIVSQIISTFLQMLVVNRILNSIFNLGLPTIGGRPAPIGDAATINTGSQFSNFAASGGAMMRGRPYIVGERGPEMFVPHTAGSLRNAHMTRSGMGGGPTVTVNQNLNFSTGVVQTVRTEVTRMLPQIASVTQASVLEGVQRGGNFRKGMHGA